MNVLINKIIKGIIRIVTRIIPLGNYIVFESIPDFSDNSKKVYDLMIKNKSIEKYKMIWLCTNKPTEKKSERAFFIYRKSPTALYYRIRAKAIICCNNFVEPYTPKQFSIYLAHGTAVKKIGNYRMPDRIHYCLAASKNTASMMMNAFSIESKRVVPLGFPRNDDLTNAPINIRRMIHKSFEKIIVWLPTFRQHSSGLKTGSLHTIPLLWNKENIIEIDKACSRLKILLVVKPHYSQDISYIQSIGTTNICFINDDFFYKNGITLYSFLGNCDALLTDYSSVYFDFTLCNKPIGLIWEDYEEYKCNPGFSINMDVSMKGGIKIYSKEDLLDFLVMVYNNEDKLKKERNEIRDYFNYSTDGKNTKRVVDFIVDEAHLSQ